MTEKTTIVNLLPGQVLDIRTPRGQQVTYPNGKVKPPRILTRDLGTWVEPPPVEPPPVEPPPVEPPPVEPPPTGQTPNVPTSIDKTGATDVTAALNNWIGSLPNGTATAPTKIVFPAGGIYRLDGSGIVLTGRKWLQFFGNGAEIKGNGPEGQNRSSIFCLWGADEDILIDGFKLTGDGSGLYKYGGPYENLHGVCSFGSKRVEIRNCVVRNTWGDGIYITNSEPGDGTYPPSEDINIHDNDFALIGRMGIAIISAKRVTVERNKFDKMSLDVLDIETDWPYPRNAVDTVLFKNNTIGSYAHSDLYRSNIFVITGSVTEVKNVTIDGNVVNASGRAINSKNDAAGITAKVTDKGPDARRTAVRFTNNRSTVQSTSIALGFEAIDGLVATGNVQPMASGVQLAYIANCTNVTKDF